MTQRKAAASFPAVCLAVPLTDARLLRYRELIDAVPAGELRDALESLHACIAAWWELPESTRTADAKRWTVEIPVLDEAGQVVRDEKGRPVRRPGQLIETPLELAYVQALWDVIPWMRELDTLSTSAADGLFDRLEGELRNAAFDLLWHAKELALDREPLTTAKLLTA